MRFGRLRRMVIGYGFSVSVLMLFTVLSFEASAESTTGAAIRITAKGGGKNPALFCQPEVSITNVSATDISALLVKLEWIDRESGAVLQPAGEFGTLVQGFSSGKTKDLFLAGHAISCEKLELAVGTYACRNSDAVKQPCPGALEVQSAGGITINTSKAQEGAMKGAVEGGGK